MNLAVDLGNTAAKAFIYDEKRLVDELVFPKLTPIQLKSILKKYSIAASIVSSVIRDDSVVKQILKEHTSFYLLSSKLALPLKNKYKTPQTLGNDRIASAVGASFLCPHQQVLVIDAGTCIKYDFVNSKGEYLGGSISPGLQMRYQALNTFTDKLPLIKPTFKLSNNFIGGSTEESITTGVEQGIINEIEGFINLYEKKYNNLKVILTGGDVKRFARAVKFPIFAAKSVTAFNAAANQRFAVPNLTGIGLNEILEYNLSKK